MVLLPGIRRDAGRRLAARRTLPIAIPAKNRPRADHGAGEIGARRQAAPGGCPAASGRPFGAAGQPRTSNDDMTCRDGAARPAQQAYQRITGFYRRGRGAGLVGAACAIHFARRDPRDAEMRSLGAPDGAIAVPDMGGRAGEGLPGGDDRGGKNDEHRDGEPSAALGQTRERGRRY